MKNKILISTLMLTLLTVLVCSYSFAGNMMQSAGNAVKSAGNTIANGTRNLANGAVNLGNDMMSGAQDMTNDTTATLDTGYTDYSATRTATAGAGLFGTTSSMATWIILGIVGAIIVGLVWYYGAQYEHRNYNND